MPRFRLQLLLLLSCIFITGCYQETPPSPQSAQQVLMELVQDPDPSVRRTAADALGKIGNPDAEPFLVGALRDEDPVVRETAARGLGRLSMIGVQAATELVLRLEDPVPSVRQIAAQALATAEGNSTLGPSLAGLLVHADAGVRQAAAHALSLVDVSELSVIEALATRSHDPDANVRQWAIAALGESGSVRARPVLIDRLRNDPVESVRGEAAYRLRFVGSESDTGQLDDLVEKERSPIVKRWIKKSRLALKTESDSGSAPRPTQPEAPVPSHRYP